ncbi:Dol-P-Glc:Glc(2)Man(9)GlcNAc(2)-PP-Dol alpha-1,2-glucosyltransferase [Tahibacter amnicola]|uniref:Dol-P-Glc:Glc(2)Man(9)GlcNAc(2)-PP-Dol alpha-1,2-glucosyltransferase n=1 Tax=Tahibacter amnicola TaxID=2976241 RepID=A0ABY6BFH3_9GAMM|nr:Dol-P-Glc:Glc(2)Man(9)GlcNAc(2)-PP-Dol alpha-1,2-glucosyltransferase [Tahibacter amnicola]UXI67361.1 Dol-P-Glc:Glc(2)Man(9)GlcNAc(2)-PP-Dol alpha-1,2-glucosyltransferase [Tahibacter amnicola]
MLWVLWLAALAYAVAGELRGDEYVHFAQIKQFLGGDYRVMRDALTTIPGYHHLLAAVLRVTGADSLGAARAVSGMWAIVAVLGFDRLYRALHQRPDSTAVLQFAWLPVAAPFVFLIYTDIASLAAMLWTFNAAVRGHHWRAACLLVGAIALRQNNVLWLAFLAVIVVVPIWESKQWNGWKEATLQGVPYLVPSLAFVGYWIWNGSVSYSGTQAAMHPDGSVHVENLYFMLFCAAILMPLHVVDGLIRFARRLGAEPWLLVAPVLLVGIFYAVYAVDHPYNLIENAASWRNRVLQLTMSSPGFKAFFVIVASLAGVGLAMQPLVNRAGWWIFPVSTLFVMLSWLVEQRYYLIPFALFLAWRKPLAAQVEVATATLWLCLAVFLFWGMMSGLWYL